MDYEIDLACGRLRIETVREDLPLDALLGFASRRNPRRGFLFVSRVLGKHVPCSPRVMRGTYDRLADQMRGVPGPVLVIGLAETATGLGGGVADSLARRDARDDVIFQHTTRHRLDAPLLVQFDEVHSHAPDHLLYAPQPSLEASYRETATLLLVDDEITTGRTLVALASRLAHRLPALQQIVLVSLVNWLDPDLQCRLTDGLPVPARFVSLLEGTFEFEPRPGFAPVLPEGMRAQWPAQRSPRPDTGRRGLAMPAGAAAIDSAIERWATLSGEEPSALTIVGTGELAYPPFLLAERLERAGCNVLFQGTTRSPILAGGDIERSLSFGDEHGEGVQNYLHNPPCLSRRPILAYESHWHAEHHPLPVQLGADVWVVPAEGLTASQSI